MRVWERERGWGGGGEKDIEGLGRGKRREKQSWLPMGVNWDTGVSWNCLVVKSCEHNLTHGESELTLPILKTNTRECTTYSTRWRICWRSQSFRGGKRSLLTLNWPKIKFSAAFNDRLTAFSWKIRKRTQRNVEEQTADLEWQPNKQQTSIHTERKT